MTDREHLTPKQWAARQQDLRAGREVPTTEARASEVRAFNHWGLEASGRPRRRATDRRLGAPAWLLWGPVVLIVLLLLMLVW